MSKNLPEKCCQQNKERIQKKKTKKKKTRERYQKFSKEKKEKKQQHGLNITKNSQKMKKINWLSLEKNI